MLIATGLLMFGFVAYQLWGTGLEYAQAQDRLEDDFAELLAASPTTTATPSPSAVPPTTGAAAAAAPSTPVATPPSTGAPPPSTGAPVTVPDFAAGDVMALLEIPSIDVATYVVAGVEPGDLKRGPGHYPNTPQPGQLGNSAIAGHRTTYGQPFFDLDEVRPGDEIVVQTVRGRYVYRATGSEVVGPDRSDVVATTDPTVARLTLTTCDPAYTARNRLVLYADLDVAASDAQPQQPVVAPPAPTTPAPTPPAASSATTAATAASAPDTTAPAQTTAPTPPPGDTEELADAFAHGWFSDDAAFAQVALWGLVVAAIGIGSWLLSRRVGRDWVGALAGIVPFVLALYFFFQNVNRLLPAAL